MSPAILRVGKLTKHLVFSGGLTQITNAFYRGTSPRAFIDSAPRTLADGQLTFSSYHGFAGTLAYRHMSNYRLDGEDATIRAVGLDLIDFSMSQHICRLVDFNLSIDNLTDKHYLETQNYFESRLRPTDPVIARIHGTPGFSHDATVGLTLRLFNKAK